MPMMKIGCAPPSSSTPSAAAKTPPAASRAMAACWAPSACGSWRSRRHITALPWRSAFQAPSRSPRSSSSLYSAKHNAAASSPSASTACSCRRSASTWWSPASQRRRRARVSAARPWPGRSCRQRASACPAASSSPLNCSCTPRKYWKSALSKPAAAARRISRSASACRPSDCSTWASAARVEASSQRATHACRISAATPSLSPTRSSACATRSSSAGSSCSCTAASCSCCTASRRRPWASTVPASITRAYACAGCRSNTASRCRRASGMSRRASAACADCQEAATSMPQPDRCSIAATLPRRSPRVRSSARRLPRSAGSSALTMTPSKNASTCGRRRARRPSTLT